MRGRIDTFGPRREYALVRLPVVRREAGVPVLDRARSRVPLGPSVLATRLGGRVVAHQPLPLDPRHPRCNACRTRIIGVIKRIKRNHRRGWRRRRSRHATRLAWWESRIGTNDKTGRRRQYDQRRLFIRTTTRPPGSATCRPEPRRWQHRTWPRWLRPAWAGTKTPQGTPACSPGTSPRSPAVRTWITGTLSPRLPCPRGRSAGWLTRASNRSVPRQVSRPPQTGRRTLAAAALQACARNQTARCTSPHTAC